MNAPATPETVAATLNIYQRLNEVRKAVEYVQKDKKVEGQGYMAVTHDAVTALVRPHLVAQGILIVPTLVEAKVAETGTTTGKGTPIIRYEGVYDIAFVNCDDPNDKIIGRFGSHALDQGDKAPGKAISYAVKMAMLKIFSLETGEDEEQRFESKAEKKGVHRPADGAGERLDEPTRNRMADIATTVQDHANADKWEAAFKEWESTGAKLTDPDAKVYAWDLLPSKTRSTLKRMKREQQTKSA